MFNAVLFFPFPDYAKRVFYLSSVQNYLVIVEEKELCAIVANVCYKVQNITQLKFLQRYGKLSVFLNICHKYPFLILLF